MSKRRMDPTLHIVTHIPLAELWDDTGPIAGSRSASLTADDLRRRLRQGPVRFVVADLDAPLNWLPASACYDFWKLELKARLAETKEFYLEDFPDEYCYLASEWRLDAGDTVILLEMYH